MFNIREKSVTPIPPKKKDDVIIKEKDRQVYFVGITGGGGSGKTKIAEYLKKDFEKCAVISEKSFFIQENKNQEFIKEHKELLDDFPDYSKERRKYLIDINNPECYDYDKLYNTLKQIKERKKVKIPFFDENKMKYLPQKEKIIDPTITNIIIVEGYFIFEDKKILKLFNLKIFKDVEDDIRLSRLALREEKYLKKNPESYKLFFEIYEYFGKETFTQIILKNRKMANMFLADYSVDENDEVRGDNILEFLKINLKKLSVS